MATANDTLSSPAGQQFIITKSGLKSRPWTVRAAATASYRYGYVEHEQGFTSRAALERYVAFIADKPRVRAEWDARIARAHREYAAVNAPRNSVMVDDDLDGGPKRCYSCGSAIRPGQVVHDMGGPLHRDCA